MRSHKFWYPAISSFCFLVFWLRLEVSLPCRSLDSPYIPGLCQLHETWPEFTICDRASGITRPIGIQDHSPRLPYRSDTTVDVPSDSHAGYTLRIRSSPQHDSPYYRTENSHYHRHPYTVFHFLPFLPVVWMNEMFKECYQESNVMSIPIKPFL